jgi:hypothetical protein
MRSFHASQARRSASFINNRDHKAEQALFAVGHVYEMLKKLNADYQAAWHGERRST